MAKTYGVTKYQSAPKQWTVMATMGDYLYDVGTYDYAQACAIVRVLRETRHQTAIYKYRGIA